MLTPSETTSEPRKIIKEGSSTRQISSSSKPTVDSTSRLKPHESDSQERLSAISYSPTGEENELPIESGIDVLRWGSVALSVLVIGLRNEPLSPIEWIAAAVVVFYTCFRTWQPIISLDHVRPRSHVASLAAEVGVHIAAVAVTGLWSSAMIYPLITSVAITGLTTGRKVALIGAVNASAVVTIIAVLTTQASQDLIQKSVANAATLFLAALISGHGYRLLAGDNEYPRSSHLRRLANANRLLADLHHVSQTLPASLDHQEVLQTSISRLRTILEFDSAAIFSIDPQDHSWETVHRVGMPIGKIFDESDVPPLAALAANEHRLIRTNKHHSDTKHFLSSSRCSMFAPLLARGNLIGLLAVESTTTNSFSRENEETLEGFVVPLGLAIDNAQWFNRIRTASLNEERNRIARNLHDNLGQSLAHLGFELDRVMLNNAEGTDISPDLVQIRQQIKHIVGQQREALHDLRSDVNERKDLAQTIEEFAGRLSEREQLTITVHSDTKARLPILQEREMWRITQEALINVGRHADATEVNVYWSCTKTEALLEVIDNGRGLLPENVDQLGSYGILGMRERATSIGAVLELISKPNQGTKVRCYLNRI